MLAHLIYCSVPATTLRATGLAQIVEHARARNRDSGITGMIACTDEAILQVLEGDIDAIAALYARIEKDTRHREVVLLAAVKAPRGRFWRWPMGFVRLGAEHGDLLVRHGGQACLAPLELDADAALDLLEALAQAQPEDAAAGIGRPL